MFFNLAFSDDNKVRQLLIDKQPYPALLRLLDHSDNYVVSDAIVSIVNLIITGSNTTPSNSHHPHFEIISSAGGIKRIFALFQSYNSNKFIKDTACLCLGILFRAKEFTNVLMKNSIIKHIKTLLTDSDDWTKQSAKFSLKDINQNEGNQKNDDDDEEEEDDDDNDDKE
ncbi:MAG: hypothetical protein EZS28_014706 [Streblomastix strix]|uniref:Uncharacterized protein n=1 Tax=Streblomastix strix TaxID=222440 RepID=A0A5J4W541_9EUKA|nr:MAG: hypothetical protein EZS28_014706 [Streblomastix strix]